MRWWAAQCQDRKRIEIERATLKATSRREPPDYEEARVLVTFERRLILRRVFYSVPSRLIGPSSQCSPLRRPARLLPRLTQLRTLRRGRPPQGSGKHVTSSTIITSSMRYRKKPMHYSIWSIAISCSRAALYARAFELLLARQSEKQAAAQWSACCDRS